MWCVLFTCTDLNKLLSPAHKYRVGSPAAYSQTSFAGNFLDNIAADRSIDPEET